MPALNYIEAVGDRLKLLLNRHAPTAVIEPANKSQIADRRKRPILAAKGSVQGATAYPSLEVRAGTTIDEAYGNPDNVAAGNDPITIDEEEPHNKLVTIGQDYELILTHDGLNDLMAAALDLEVAVAIRKGGRQLADPLTPNSKIDYVVSWGPITTTRERRRKQGDARQISTITVRTWLQIYTGELNP